MAPSEVIENQLALDLEAGEAAKTEGISRANSNVEAEWAKRFDAEMLRMAKTGEVFTAEDALILVGLPPGHMNAVGARTNALARQGFIEPVGYQKAQRAKRHAGMIRVWRGTGK